MQRKGKIKYNIRNKLHSIPKLKKNVKSNVVYSIPVCMLALCLGLISGNDCYANAYKDVDAVATDAGTISPLPDVEANTSVSLSLSTTKLTGDTISPGQTTTASTVVTAEVRDAENYALILSVDDDTMQNGDTILITGDVTTDNTWGYKWELDNSTNYKAPTTAGTTLTIVPLDDTGVANFTSTLTFGARFSSNATPGTYHANGTLSLTAAPKATVALTLANITEMQQIKPEICAATPYIDGEKYSETYKLTDVRDNSIYTVQKLEDGKCWMTSNLKLSNQHKTTYYYLQGRLLNPTTSDVSTDWTLPVPSVTGFSSDTAINIYFNADTSSVGAKNAVYYTWCAATAGTCGSTDTDGNAPDSVCPRGWKLPASTDFAALNTAGGISAGNVSPWTYTGYMLNSSTENLSKDQGHWWSRTRHSNDHSYSLAITNDVIYPTNAGDYNRLGFTVRCITR